MTSANLDELLREFDHINRADDVELLKWLYRMFEACEDAGCELPDRLAIAGTIDAGRHLGPNPTVPGNPPEGDRTEWLIRESLGTLLYDGDPEHQAELYGITALAVRSWLDDLEMSQ